MIDRCDASWTRLYVNEREKLDAEWQEPGSVEVHTDPAAVRHV